MTPLDHSKATRELGWVPRPVEDSIREAAIFFGQSARAIAAARLTGPGDPRLQTFMDVPS